MPTTENHQCWVSASKRLFLTDIPFKLRKKTKFLHIDTLSFTITDTDFLCILQD